MKNEAEIKDRIRKLLRVAEDDASSEAEIEVAMSAAKSAMDRHHLDESDLIDEPEDQWKAIEAAHRDRTFVSVGRCFHAWENYLASFAAEFVGGVGVYRDPSKDRIARNHRGIAILNEQEEPYKAVRFCFYGIAEDAMMAAELFHEMWLTIRTMARLRWGTCYTKDGGYYAQGFVVGLFDKIKAAKMEQKKIAQQTSDSRTLILVARRDDLIERKKASATEWLAKSTGIKLRKGSGASGANGSHQAWQEGFSDGQRTDVEAARRAKIGC